MTNDKINKLGNSTMGAMHIAYELQARADGTVLSSEAFDEMAVGLRKMIGARLPVELHRGETFTDGPVIRGVSIDGDYGRRSVSVDVEFDEKTDPMLLLLIGARGNIAAITLSGLQDAAEREERLRIARAEANEIAAKLEPHIAPSPKLAIEMLQSELNSSRLRKDAS